MSATELNKEIDTKYIKLYSSRAISGATFLGGPLAAGYMIGENFKSLEKPNEGRNSLIIGVLSTVLLFVGLFMTPENIIDKIPGQIIPLIYTAIIVGLVEWRQGKVLKRHKENGNDFYSGWKAAGIGFVSLIILCVGVFGYVFFGTDNEVYDKYDSELSVFAENEAQTLVFYDHLNTESRDFLVQELEEKAIPKWRENIGIINKTNGFDGLPTELIQQNKVLLKYAELRIEAFELFKKAIEEDTDSYSSQLDKIHEEIDEQLGKLN